MHLPLLPLAGILGLGGPELFVIVVVLGFSALVPVAIVAIVSALKHRQQKMWHDTARLALEKGQPLPPPLARSLPSAAEASNDRNDIRTGLILIAVGIGIALFFRSVGAREAMGIGAIPGFIGVALFLFGLFFRAKSAPKDRPPLT